eukprot:INCI4784.1.p1 GENE.INCI4784.1~~INCI4784.1.p1  ORF type:complete len:591 (-),score=64.47 INCI4784.1:69-1709(-)
MTLFMQIAPCNSLGEPFPFNAVAEIIIGSFVVSEADAAAARHHYQQLKARMTRSSVIGNITNRCQQHCVALNQTGTSCVKKLQHTVVEAVEATMHADCRFQPPQVANLVRALTSMFFDTITVSDLGRISSTAYANAFMNGCNNTMCYDTHDDCDNERKCKTGSMKGSCCLCGGGTYAEEKGLTYDKALPQKTVVFIGGSHFSGTSLLEVILDQSQETSVFHHTWTTENEGQHVQDVFEPALKLGGVNFGCHVTVADERNFTLFATEANSRRIWAQWSRYWNPRKSILIEKSPPDILRFPALQALFRQAKKAVFLATMRHPMASFFTVMKMFEKRDKSSTKQLVKARCDKHFRCWLNLHHWFRRAAPTLNNIRLIRFEDFMSNFDTQLRNIEQLLGLQAPIRVEKVGAEPTMDELGIERHRLAEINTRLKAQVADNDSRRQLFFHGDKQNLVVNLSMGSAWHTDYQWIYDNRKVNVPLGELQGIDRRSSPTLKEWRALSWQGKISSMLSDNFVARLDVELKPFGYSLSDAFHLGELQNFNFGPDTLN